MNYNVGWEIQPPQLCPEPWGNRCSRASDYDRKSNRQYNRDCYYSWKERGPPAKKEVSSKWWAQEKRAEKARQRLIKELQPDQSSGIQMVSIGKSDEMIGDRYKSEILLRKYPERGLNIERGVIPDRVDGIPIRMAEPINVTPDSCKKEVNIIEGGDPVDEPDSTGPGSATCTVIQDGETRLMTAAHVVQSQCDVSPVYTDVYNYNTDKKRIGALSR
ncbi:hypothetical protein [Halogranum gelatinilyticum]|uniref:hypothetical protein n=1 Tax=Halogranum gelatinilyticum TaxID=660521 RepID=UPI0011133164|nr:hypothetical protein [Halogranum gelatinilyticum]